MSPTGYILNLLNMAFKPFSLQSQLTFLALFQDSQLYLDTLSIC